MKNSSSAQLALSPHDHLQALKRHPEFQLCLAIWRNILRKEEKGLPITDEEEAMKWAPRSMFNVEAEMEASRYQSLSWEEHERATMTEEERAWRDCTPQCDWVNKVAAMEVPLHWPVAAIEKIVGRIVRVYKERLGLQHGQYPPVEWRERGATLNRGNQTVMLRIPLDQAVEAIDTIVGQIVRTYKTALGLTSHQRLRRPEHVDPWAIYDLRRDKNRSLADIVRTVFGVSGNPAYDPDVKRRYEQVRRAYDFAEAAIDRVGQEYANKDS